LSRGEFTSHGFATLDIDIEKGFDVTVSQGESTSRTKNSLGHVHDSLGHVLDRLADMTDSLLGLNIQGSVSLASYITLTSNVIMFLYVLGFLAALGGKLFCRPRVGAIGSMATILAFLINIAMLVIYKI